MDPLIILFLILAATWYWAAGLRSKELARRAAQRACERAGVQLLDDTVQRERQWLCRGASGRVQLCRRFGFEFTSDGARRYRGNWRWRGCRFVPLTWKRTEWFNGYKEITPPGRGYRHC